MSGKASLRDLDEWYGTEDLYDMLEMIVVEARNSEMMRKAAERS